MPRAIGTIKLPERQIIRSSYTSRRFPRQIPYDLLGVTFSVGNEHFWGHDALDMVLDYLRDPDATAVERPRAATMRDVPRTNAKMIAPDAR